MAEICSNGTYLNISCGHKAFYVYFFKKEAVDRDSIMWKPHSVLPGDTQVP